MPIVLEIICLLFVGIYGQFYYQRTLEETEYLVALMLFATGLQNGLTASISNFSIKQPTLQVQQPTLGSYFLCLLIKSTERIRSLLQEQKCL